MLLSSLLATGNARPADVTFPPESFSDVNMVVVPDPDGSDHLVVPHWVVGQNELWESTPATFGIGGTFATPVAPIVPAVFGRADFSGLGAPIWLGSGPEGVHELANGYRVVWLAERDCAIATVDLDLDGADDLVTDHGIWWGGGAWLAEGARFEIDGEYTAGPYDSVQTVCARVTLVGDLDGDGMPEILRGANTTTVAENRVEAQIALYLSSDRPSDTTQWTPAWEFAHAEYPHVRALVPLQLDGDAALELAVHFGRGTAFQDVHVIALYDDLNVSGVPTEMASSMGPYLRLFASAGDIDQDGDDELVVGGPGFGLDAEGYDPTLPFRFLEADLDGDLWTDVGEQAEPTWADGTPMTIETENHGLGASATTGDFDGDGSVDLAVMAWGNGYHSLQVWLRGAPSPITTSTEDTGIPSIPEDTGASSTADTATTGPSETEDPGADGDGKSVGGTSACGCTAASSNVAWGIALGALAAARRRAA